MKLKVWNQYLKCWENCFELRTENKVLKAFIEDDINECEVEAVIVKSTGLLWDMEKDIYCGDIVKLDNGMVAKIVYERGMYILGSREFEDGYERLSEFHSEDKYCDLEVIGNIYENPELIAGVKEECNCNACTLCEYNANIKHGK